MKKIKKLLLLSSVSTMLFTMSGWDKKETTVAFGDSNTQGANWSMYDYDNDMKWVNKLDKNIPIFNAGIAGNTTADAKKRFQKDVLDKKPKTVILMFGTNDAVIKQNGKPKVTKEQFNSNMRYFTGKLRERKIKIILMTTIPVIESKYYSRHNKKLYAKYGGAREFHDSYNDITRTIARQRGYTLVDNYRTIVKEAGGETDKDLLGSGFIDPTGTHFTECGANVVYLGLKKVLDK